jgi:hypothetical protein
VSALVLEGRTIWIVDAHGYGRRFILLADEKLTAFVELESAISQSKILAKEAAREVGLREQEQHYPCSPVLP